MTALTTLRRELHSLANPQIAEFLQRFFKTAPGEYGHGDQFLGIRVPQLRAIAKSAGSVTIDEAVTLLQSVWHEERFVALMLMVHRYRTGTSAAREVIYNAYLANTSRINNWDLVDASAEHIVGAHHVQTRNPAITQLAHSHELWERRIAMMATFHDIRRGDFAVALTIATLLLHDKHDLIHKAVGWMLREIGKRDPACERAFLAQHYRQMPRTMLRYAIERFPEPERKSYLLGRAHARPE